VILSRFFGQNSHALKPQPYPNKNKVTFVFYVALAFVKIIVNCYKIIARNISECKGVKNAANYHPLCTAPMFFLCLSLCLRNLIMLSA